MFWLFFSIGRPLAELPPVIHTRIQTKTASAPVAPFDFILSDVAIINGVRRGGCVIVSLTPH